MEIAAGRAVIEAAAAAAAPTLVAGELAVVARQRMICNIRCRNRYMIR